MKFIVHTNSQLDKIKINDPRIWEFVLTARRYARGSLQTSWEPVHLDYMLMTIICSSKKDGQQQVHFAAQL